MEFLGVLVFCIVFLLIMRLFGSWMLRIDDVIHYQKELVNSQKTVIEELKKLNSNKE